MPLDWKTTLITKDDSIEKAIETLNQASQFCIVVDLDSKLIGTVTDGDVRRGILKGVGLDQAVDTIMNHSPLSEIQSAPVEAMRSNMLQAGVRYLPLLDDTGCVAGLASLNELTSEPPSPENWVVLMAGGLGSRLKPFTNSTPKPLLRVGDQPMLQIILESFVAQNFKKFFISVNYKSEEIKSHFGDGSRWSVQINYLEEDRRLGTAGALNLLPEDVPNDPIIVMNGDLLTQIDFNELLEFHKQQEASATMCIRDYEFQIPYGVIQMEDTQLQAIIEKPIQKHFVNAGIYIIEPELLKIIKPAQYFDMTELFEMLINENKKTAAYPIHEYWMDVGGVDDLQRANRDFEELN